MACVFPYPVNFSPVFNFMLITCHSIWRVFYITRHSNKTLLWSAATTRDALFNERPARSGQCSIIATKATSYKKGHFTHTFFKRSNNKKNVEHISREWTGYEGQTHFLCRLGPVLQNFQWNIVETAEWIREHNYFDPIFCLKF